MYNQTDIKEVVEFIMGMTITTKEKIEEKFKMGEKIPDTISFLLKRKNDMGEVVYDINGTIVPKDGFSKFLNNQIFSEIIRMGGDTILCKCETIFNSNTLKVKFTDYIKGGEFEEEHQFNVTPSRVSDINSFMGEPICLN
jgi:hypothetical protein